MNGWIDNPIEARRMIAKGKTPSFCQNAFLINSGEGKALSWVNDKMEIINGIKFPSYEQGQAMDCVSIGYAKALSIVLALDTNRGLYENYLGEISSEAIHLGARNVIGRHCIKQYGWTGAMGAWAVEWIREYGVVVRDIFHVVNSKGVGVKLNWGFYQPNQDYDSLNDETILWEVQKNRIKPVKETALVQNYEMARDALANGFPVLICSDIEFGSFLDEDGFISFPSKGSSHCYCCVGFNDVGRKGLLMTPSQACDDLEGLGIDEVPACFFYVDAEVVDKMLKKGDSYAISGIEGFRKYNYI